MMNRRVTNVCLLAVLVPVMALLAPSPAFSGGTFQSMVNPDKTTQDLPATAGVGGQWESGESLSLPPESHPAGRSYGEWAAAYIQWVVTTDADLGPVFGQDLPSSNVWFVEPGCADRTYTMPTGTFLLAPIWWAWNEYGCPWDPPLNEIPSLEDYLLEGLAWFYPPPEEVPLLGWEVLVDGRPVDNLAAYLATSSMFDVTFDPSWAPYDPCVVSGEVQPCVAGGYFVMLKPFPPGWHTLEYRGVCDPPTTIHIHVVPTRNFDAFINSGAEFSTWGVVKSLYR